MNPLDRLIELARSRICHCDEMIALANKVLGVAEPCGFPLPERIGDKIMWPGVFDDELTPEEAQGLAIALLRRAVGG